MGAKLKSYKKLLALGLAITLSLPNPALAQEVFATLALEIAPNEIPYSIPADIGNIRNFHVPSGKKADQQPFFIYIQDAHANFEAQKSIKQILSYLSKEYGLGLVGVEGAISPLEPNVLKFFHDADKNSGIAERLVKSGELSGVEWFAVEQQGQVKLTGIEDADLYRDNILAFQELVRNQDKIEELLKNLDGSLQNLKGNFYNNQLLQFDRKVSKGRSELFGFIRFLDAQIRQNLNLDFKSIGNQVRYPFFTRLAYLVETEKKLNLKRITAEKETLVKELKLKAGESSPGIRHAVEMLETLRTDKTHEIDRAKYKTYGEFFEAIYRYGREAGIDFGIYESFRQWASVLILQEEIQQEGLFEEIDQLVELLYQHYAVEPEEKEVLALSRNIDLAHKLVRGELTRKDYEKVLQNQGLVAPRAIRKRMNDIVLHAGSKGKRSVFSLGSDDEWESLKKFNDLAMNFYAVTVKRDRTMVENSFSIMKKNHAPVMAMVCGGFHTDGMIRLLEERNAGYLIVTPHVKLEAEGNTKYHEAILQNRKTIFDQSRIASIIKLVEDKFYSSSLPGDLAKRNDVIAEEALVSLVAEIQAQINEAIRSKPGLAALLPVIADGLDEALKVRINELVSQFSSNPISRNISVSVNKESGTIQIDMAQNGRASPVLFSVRTLSQVPEITVAEDVRRMVEKPRLLAASLGQENLTDIRALALKRRWAAAIAKSDRMTRRVQALAQIERSDLEGLAEIQHFPDYEGEVVRTRPWHTNPVDASKPRMPYHPLRDGEIPGTDGFIKEWAERRPERVAGKGYFGNETWIIGVNNLPITEYQFFMFPEKGREQRTRRNDFRAGLEILDSVGDPEAVIGHNSLHGGASLNSLHLHLFFPLEYGKKFPFFENLKEGILIKTQGTVTVSSFNTDNPAYPVPGRVFSGEDFDELDQIANLYLDALEEAGVPYNYAIRQGEIYILPVGAEEEGILELLGRHTFKDRGRAETVSADEIRAMLRRRSLPESEIVKVDTLFEAQLARAAALGVQEDLRKIDAATLKARWDNTVSPRVEALFAGAEIVRRYPHVAVQYMPNMPVEKNVAERPLAPWERPENTELHNPGKPLKPAYPFDPNGPNTDGLLEDYRAKRRTKEPDKDRIIGEFMASSGNTWYLGPNNGPILRWQTMVMPAKARAQRPLLDGVKNYHDIRDMMEMTDQLKDRNAVIGFNALNANASLNSLHLQLFLGIHDHKTSETLPFALFDTAAVTPIETLGTTIYGSLDNDQGPVIGRVFSGQDYAEVERLVNAYLRILEEKDQGVPYSLMFRPGKVYVVSWNQRRGPGLLVWGTEVYGSGQEDKLKQSEAEILAHWKRFMVVPEKHAEIDREFSAAVSAKSLGVEDEGLATELFRYIALKPQTTYESDSKTLAQIMLKDDLRVPDDDIAFFSAVEDPVPELIEIYMKPEGEVLERRRKIARRILEGKNDGYKIPSETMDLFDTLRLKPVIDEEIRSGKIMIDVTGVIAQQDLIGPMNEYYGGLGEGTAMRGGLHWNGFADITEAVTPPRRWGGNAPSIFMGIRAAHAKSRPLPPDFDGIKLNFILLNPGFGSRLGIVTKLSSSKGDVRFLGSRMNLQGIEQAKFIAHFLYHSGAFKKGVRNEFDVTIPADNIILVAAKVADSFTASSQFYVFAKDDDIEVANIEQADLSLLKKLTELGQYLLDKDGKIKDNGFVEKPHMFKLLRLVARNAIQEAFHKSKLTDQEAEQDFYEQIRRLLPAGVRAQVEGRGIESLIDFFVIPQILGQGTRGVDIWNYIYSDLQKKYMDEVPWLAQISETIWERIFAHAFQFQGIQEQQNLEKAFALVDRIRPFLKTYSNGFLFVSTREASELMLSGDAYGHSYTFPGNGTFAEPTIPRPHPADLDMSKHILEAMITPTLEQWMNTPTPDNPSGKYTAAAQKIYDNPKDWELLWRIARKNIAPKVGGLTPATFGRFWADTGRIVDILDFYKRAVNSSHDPIAVADRLIVRGLFGLPMFENIQNSLIEGTVLKDDEDSYLIMDSVIKVPPQVTLVLGKGARIDGSYIDLTKTNLRPGTVVRIPAGSTIAGSIIEGPITGTATDNYIYHLNATQGFDFDSLPQQKYEFLDEKGKAKGTFIIQNGKVVLSTAHGISVGNTDIRVSKNAAGKLEVFRDGNYQGIVNQNPVHVFGTTFTKTTTGLPREVHLGHNITFDPASKEPIYAVDTDGNVLSNVNMGDSLFGGDKEIGDYVANGQFGADLRTRIRTEVEAAQASSLGTGVANPSALYTAAENYLRNLDDSEEVLHQRLLKAGMDEESIKLLKIRREAQKFDERIASGKLIVIPVFVSADKDMADDTVELLRHDRSGILKGLEFLTADWGSRSRPAGSKRGGNSSNVFAALYKLLDPTLPDGRENPDYLPPLTSEQITNGVTRVVIIVNNAGPGSRFLGLSAAGVTKGDAKVGFATISNLALEAGEDFSQYFRPGDWIQVVSSDNAALVSADVENALKQPDRKFFMFPYQARILPDIDKDGRAIESTLPEYSDYEDLMGLGHALINPDLKVEGFEEKPNPLYEFLNVLLSYHMAKMAQDWEHEGDAEALKKIFFQEFAKILHMDDPDSPASHLLPKQKDFLEEHVFLNWLLPGKKGDQFWEKIFDQSVGKPFRGDITLDEWMSMRRRAIQTVEATIAKYGSIPIQSFFSHFVERARYTTANTFFFAFTRDIAETMISTETGFRNPFKEPGFGSPAIPLKRNFNLDWATILLGLQVATEAEALAMYAKDRASASVTKLQQTFPYKEKDGYPSDWMKNWHIMQNITQKANGLSAAPFGRFWYDTGLVHTFYDMLQLLVSPTDPIKRVLMRALFNIPITQSIHNSRVVEITKTGSAREIHVNFSGESLIFNSIIRVPAGVTLIIEPGVVIDTSDLYLEPKLGEKTVVITAGTVISHARIKGQVTPPSEAVARKRLFYHYISDNGLNFNQPGDVHVSIYRRAGQYPANDPWDGLIQIAHPMDDDPKKIAAISAFTPDGQPLTGFTVNGKPDGPPGISWLFHIFPDANVFPETSAANKIQDPQRNNNWTMRLEDSIINALQAPLDELAAQSLGTAADLFVSEFRAGIIPLRQVSELRKDPARLDKIMAQSLGGDKASKTPAVSLTSEIMEQAAQGELQLRILKAMFLANPVFSGNVMISDLDPESPFSFANPNTRQTIKTVMTEINPMAHFVVLWPSKDDRALAQARAEFAGLNLSIIPFDGKIDAVVQKALNGLFKSSRNDIKASGIKTFNDFLSATTVIGSQDILEQIGLSTNANRLNSLKGNPVLAKSRQKYGSALEQHVLDFDLILGNAINSVRGKFDALKKQISDDNLVTRENGVWSLKPDALVLELVTGIVASWAAARQMAQAA